VFRFTRPNAKRQLVIAGLIGAVAFIVALAAPPDALAHANLIRSDPANGAVVASPPRAIRLFFDDPIRAQGGMKAVRNGGSSILAGSPRVLGQRTLVIPLRRGLRRGDYTVLWRALSDDGHPVGGVLAFAVGAGRARPQPALTLTTGRDSLQILERWLFLSGVLAASGAALLTLTLRQSAPPPLSLFLVAFILVVCGAVPLALRTSLSTRFGTVVTGASIVATAGAIFAAGARRYPRLSPLTWIMALLLLPAPSLAGHALDAGRPRLELPVDILHVAASSTWLGGLLALAVHFRRGDAREAVVRRFSALALGSVLVLAATGVVRAFAELTSVGHLWTTSYGRLLLVKTLLLAALVTIGWNNRYRVIPALTHSASRLRRNVFAELVLLLGLVVAVAILTQTRPDRDRLAILAPSATASGRTAPEGEASVLDQRKDGLLLDGTPARAVVVDGRYVVWETFGSDGGAVAALVQRDLRIRRSTTVARDIAPQYGLAVTSRLLVYATATLPPRLVAVDRSGGPQLLLARRLLAPFAWLGDRIAWAEQVGDRQRIVVRNLVTGNDWLAADIPTCERGRCYRIDAVTLADSGVVFDRGAIGTQPSFVVRRAFSVARPESVRLMNDPQPDLVPSSAGALYYALGEGWRRWDFGHSNVTRTHFKINGSAQPIRYEHGRWFVQEQHACDDTIVAQDAGARHFVVGSPATARALAGVTGGYCAKFINLTWRDGRPVTSWAIAPADAHSHAEPIGVIVFGPAIR
jgi:copper transport protein